MVDAKILIGDERSGGHSYLEIVDPSNGKVFARVPDGSPADIDHAVETAKRAGAVWAITAPAARAAVLRRLSSLILREQEALAVLEARQTGKPLKQSRRDAEITARYFDFYASAIESFHGETIPLNRDTLIYTRWEPHGVTGHIVPWNYPMSIMARSIAPSLAMGNACVLKPAEATPLTALRIGELALEAGLSPGLFNIVTGTGHGAGAALCAHPGIGHVSFTGSVAVGRLISHAAADRLIPVTMELGGKSPNIVFADCDLSRALPIIANSILQNAGQTCSAGSRLLVHESVHSEVLSWMERKFTTTTIGPALEDPDLGPLISHRQRERVLGFIEEAGDGGKLVCGGHRLNGGSFGDGFFMEPTLFDDVDPASPLGRDEVFGPVLSVIRFKSYEQAVTIANDTDYGLVTGVWTSDISIAHRAVADITAGQVFVNSYGASGGVEIPFGGTKQSGFGREKGVEGLRGFATLKTAVVGL